MNICVNGDDDRLLSVFFNVNPLLIKFLIELPTCQPVHLDDNFSHIDFIIILVHDLKVSRGIFE